MTPGCTTQACDFTANLDAIEEAGYTVLGISPDKPEKLAKFRAEGGLTFPLLSDPTKETLEAYGAYGEKQLYGKTVVGVIRSTFVIDEKGIIETALYNVRAKGHVDKAPHRPLHLLAPLTSPYSTLRTTRSPALAQQTPHSCCG